MKRGPTRFGKYHLLQRIGMGGMAEVFKAKVYGAEGFERLVAIKRILPQLAEDEQFAKMFIDEAKIAVQLTHPNIVGIHDLGKAEDTLFIAMEFVSGKDVRAIYDRETKRNATTPIDVACHLIMKMCEALHHAHFATGPGGEHLQFIHRDVSPQNVLVSYDGAVKVADFGLAKAKGRLVQTQAGVVKGKLAYMSPEQLRGEEIDHRVDIFGIGIVLFEMLTSTRLFLGSNDMETLKRVYEADVPSISALNPEVPTQLEEITRRALAKEPGDRYSTALELHEDLQAFVYGHGVYCGSAQVRRYMREAFPKTAPEETALSFTSVPPPAPTESGIQASATPARSAAAGGVCAPPQHTSNSSIQASFVTRENASDAPETTGSDHPLLEDALRTDERPQSGTLQVNTPPRELTTEELEDFVSEDSDVDDEATGPGLPPGFLDDEGFVADDTFDCWDDQTVQAVVPSHPHEEEPWADLIADKTGSNSD